MRNNLRIWLRLSALVPMLLACVFSIAAKTPVVMLDPGHGAHDPGAEGKQLAEKTVNLKVALEVGEILAKELPRVKVEYTRRKDRFVSLVDRCRMANNAGADLFVSIHCDSSEANPERTGTTIYVPQEKLTSSSRSNGTKVLQTDGAIHIAESNRLARMLSREIEKNTGRVNRGVRRGEYLVIQYTRMPAVMVEMEYICNKEGESFLNSADGQHKMARAIANAIIQYMSTRDDGSSSRADTAPGANTSKSDKKSTAQPKAPESSKAADKTKIEEATPTSQLVYKVQFLTSSRMLKANDPALHGLSGVSYYMDGKIYKYTYGETESDAEASKILSTVRKLFPDAFIVKFKDGQRIR